MSLHYLIDGFNVLYAMEPIPEGTWEDKRAALLTHLQSNRFHGRNRMTIVFDSKEGMGDRHQQGEDTIIYTSGETADDWISRYVRGSSNARVIVVVTNDQGLRALLRGTGAKVISSDDFLQKGSSTPPTRSARPSQKDFGDITDELRKKWLD